MTPTHWWLNILVQLQQHQTRQSLQWKKITEQRTRPAISAPAGGGKQWRALEGGAHERPLPLGKGGRTGPQSKMLRNGVTTDYTNW